VYCVVTNSAGPAYSQMALLEVERRMAHWKLDNNMDDSENGYHGIMIDPNTNPWNTNIPAPDYDPCGINGQAMEFFGEDDDDEMMEITGDPNDFNNYHLGLTASAWYKSTDPNTWKIIVGKQDRVQWAGWTLNVSPDGNPQLATFAGPYATASATVDDGGWHLITGTYDGSVVKIYVDGGLDTESAPSTFVLPANTAPVIIGGQNTALDTEDVYSWKGLADDVQIYNYALSPEDVVILYNNFIEPDKNFCLDRPASDISGPTGVPDCKVDLYDSAAAVSEWLKCDLHPDCP